MQPGQGDGQSGFTLLEVLVVLVIIGFLVGLAAPAVFGKLGTAKSKVAEAEVARIAGAVDLYTLDVGRPPTTEQGLQALLTKPAGIPRWDGPYLKGGDVPHDPWGRAYGYQSPSRRPGHDYDLFSLGADGAPEGTGENADLFNR